MTSADRMTDASDTCCGKSDAFHIPKYAKKDPCPYKVCVNVDDADASCVNTIRCLSAAAVGKAKSGHPGAPMGCAVMAQALFGHVMNISGDHPHWPNRDRFVLSNGHASALLYTMLHLIGNKDMTIDQLKQFRQVGSLTPGHPENHMTSGIEVTTGPLGQGLANAVGLAIGARVLAETFGKDQINNRTYVIFGDGCLQEGVSQEACSLAGTLKLEGLIGLYDRNGITIDGSTTLSFTDDIPAKFAAWDWEVLYLKDGDSDLPGLLALLEKAQNVKNKPVIIICDTTIGFGSSKQGTAGVHGAPLAEADYLNVRKTCGYSEDVDSFFSVPEDVVAFYASRQKKQTEKYNAWLKTHNEWRQANAQLAAEFDRRVANKNIDVSACLAKLTDLENKMDADAPRNVSSKILKLLATAMPELIGGSADLMESNKTNVVTELQGIQSSENPKGRCIYFGIREHAMCAISNGLAAYGGFRPFDATFLNFFSYAWGAVRLGALSHLPVLHIATHDSIELGEDGPTHQPIEIPALCRATPHLDLIRPGDANEVIGAYHCWLSNTDGPTIIALARGKVPNYNGKTKCAEVAKGAYILEDFDASSNGKKIILASSGSELHIAMETAEELRKSAYNVRIISMPCWSLFKSQSAEYKSKLFPKDVPAGLMEPYSSYGIETYFKPELSVCLDEFGLSGPAAKVREALGFTVSNWCKKVNAAGL